MKQFLKFTFASVLGFLISIFILGVVFVFFLLALVSSFDNTESISISDNTILELKLDYEVPERTTNKPEFDFAFIPSFNKTMGLNDLTKVIRSAKDDNKIKGIFINLDNLYVGGLAKLSSLRNALIDFKSSNKFIIAHGNSINEKGYYLASVADSIYLNPTGNFEFDGFCIEVTFFKKALDKLEIKPQIFQYGKFKSATEPYKSDRLSEENKLQLNQFLSSAYSKYLTDISEGINLSKSKLENIANNLLIQTSKDALQFNLVKGLLYRDEVDSLIKKMMSNDLEVSMISSERYLHSINNYSGSTNNRIAIIYALGEIHEGNGDEFTIGKKNIINSIRKAKDNKRVKAIVMRVNSPCGSPLTSDMIWREIKLAASKKPFIVSMSEVAASGGYYISTGAHTIVAEPYTLTGSIGVYGIIPNTQDFFNNKLGITFDEVKSADNSNPFKITKPLNESQRKLIAKQIDEVYYNFANRVAEGRKMSFDEVDMIGQGRIWSGMDAKDIGLVDTLGGLELAINIAVDKADIDDYKIIEYPKQKKAFEKIFEILSSKIEINFTPQFSDPFNQIHKLENALKYTGIQTRLPFIYNIN